MFATRCVLPVGTGNFEDETRPHVVPDRHRDGDGAERGATKPAGAESARLGQA
jgi:hypothetical protein